MITIVLFLLTIFLIQVTRSDDLGSNGFTDPTGVCNRTNPDCDVYGNIRYCCTSGTLLNPHRPTVDAGTSNCYCSNTNPQIACSSCNFQPDVPLEVSDADLPNHIFIACYTNYGCEGYPAWNVSVPNDATQCYNNSDITHVDYPGYNYLLSCNANQLVNFKRCTTAAIPVCSTCSPIKPNGIVPAGYCSPSLFTSYESCIYFCGSASTNPANANSASGLQSYAFLLSHVLLSVLIPSVFLDMMF